MPRNDGMEPEPNASSAVSISPVAPMPTPSAPPAVTVGGGSKAANVVQFPLTTTAAPVAPVTPTESKLSPMEEWAEKQSALDVAKAFKQLTPEELAYCISWASNDPENPLSDEHLEALIKSAQYVLNKRAAS